jgi:SHAQKYF class myb-like DNA-binding protein
MKTDPPKKSALSSDSKNEHFLESVSRNPIRKILALMKVEGLTRHNIASHLQIRNTSISLLQHGFLKLDIIFDRYSEHWPIFMAVLEFATETLSHKIFWWVLGIIAF